MKQLWQSLMLVVVCGAGLVLTACETVKGVGKDIQGGAETVQGWF